MNEKDNFEFNFDEKVEDLFSNAKKSNEDEYEDIVSHSAAEEPIQFEDISSSSSEKSKEKSGFIMWWKKLSGVKKGLLITVTSLFLVLAVMLGWVFTQYARVHVGINYNELNAVEIKDENIMNIALFGVDSRDENVFSGNTDSIMIMSINKKNQKIKIFSVMRDTLVPMDYKGSKYCAKINSAYAKSPEHAINTLNEVFDLDIHNYATVNFFGMRDIIDAVGGITATITDDELAQKGADHPNLNQCMDEICRELGLNPKDYHIKKSGKQQLNGVQAVAYARVRHCRNVWGTNNDYGRTDRQRYVMQELFNKATKINTTEYLGLANALVPCTKTSLDIGNIVSIATEVLGGSPKFEQYRLPQNEAGKNMVFTGPTGYGSIVYYDLDYAAKMINAVIYDDVTIDEFIEENPIEKNDWYYDKTEYHGSKKPSGGSSQQTTPPPVSSETVTPEPTPSEPQTPGGGEDTDVCEHKNTKVVDRVEPTLETEGYTGDTYCTDCGEKIKDGEVIDKLEPENGEEGGTGDEEGGIGDEGQGDQGSTGEGDQGGQGEEGGTGDQGGNGGQGDNGGTGDGQTGA